MISFLLQRAFLPFLVTTAVVRQAAEQGARSVQVHPLTMHGRAVTSLPGARPDSTELAIAIFEAARLGDELGVAVQVDALTRQQIVTYREYLVPEPPVKELVDVAPILVIGADGSVTPLTHEVSPPLGWGLCPLRASHHWHAIGSLTATATCWQTPVSALIPCSTR
ncbi:MAG: hypothetical protein DMG65_17145 [Candidatus Angelobacter sp. Gp1-AA117]|nr:MAG: hypothetical protein DMG65_17145 [Candidatus Angelobacter sp. Gp1-AA117]